MSNEKYCAPSKDKFNVSCYTLDTLKKIINSYNKTANNKIVILKQDTKKSLYDKILDNIKCSNKDDICILNKIQENSDYRELYEMVQQSLKPLKPAEWTINPKQWASTTNIDNVMEQYESAYPEFFYVGAVPIDFDSKYSGSDMCIVDDLCKLDLRKLWKDGKTKIGVVFNLDPHDKSGSHWVSFYVDFKTAGIYFFDSTSNEPPQEVKELMDRIKKQGDKLLLNDKNFRKFSNNNIHDIGGKHCFRKFYNDKVHQEKNSECGIYSIFFLTEMLKGKTFINFVENKFKDDYIFKMRDVYWRS